jgi:hypothetical protein
MTKEEEEEMQENAENEEAFKKLNDFFSKMETKQ